MKISFVTDCLGYGGAEKMLLFVANGLSDLGHDVAIFNLNTIETSNKENLNLKKIKVIEAGFQYKNQIVTNVQYVSFTVKAARKHQTEVIVGFKKLANFCAVIAGKLLNVPSIVSERGDPAVSFRSRTIFNRMKLYTINKANGAVFQTKEASLYYSSKLQKSGVVIPNPISKPVEVQPVDYEKMPKEVIFMGRLANRQKRLDVMIKSFAYFHDRHPDYILRIYGDGPDEVLLKRLINERQLSPYVILMGVSKKPMEDLCKGGIFLLTSDFEGISNSLLEAMAVGLPVVSTDHTPGGARLLITDHHNGLLAPMGNHISLGHALCEFADNGELAQSCGRAAQYVLKAFSPENILGQWSNYIESIRK